MNRRLAKLVLYVSGLLMSLALAGAAAGFRINTSPSIPTGLYRVGEGSIGRGSYVAICPPQVAAFSQARERGYVRRGSCPGDYGELLKVLAAVEGDHVAIARSGVFVNGVLWPASQPRPTDAVGRPLPSLVGFEQILWPGEVFVLSDGCAEGFDSRYFGPLPHTALVGPSRLLARFRL